jgi:uncharacterized membrane protein YdjX (TVP38/TMEM64 family)
MNVCDKWMFSKRKVMIFVVLLVLALLAVSNFAEKNIDLNEIRDYVASFGSLAPVVLLLMIIITSSIGFVFMIPVAVAALLLNIWMAFAVSIVGLTIGAIVSFVLSRTIGRDYFERKYVSKTAWLKKYDNHLKKNGLLAVFFFRLIPLFPYELVNIGAGLSRITFLQFIMGTLFGIVPGIVATIYFIASAEDIFSKQFLIASLLIMALSIIPLFFKKVRKIIF